MIRGKKNYLPVAPMAMGFCFFFKLNEESVANHVNDRKVKYAENAEAAVEEQPIGENDEEELAFPDTKIRTSKSDRHEPDMILEAMKPRSKVQRKLKKPEKKAAEKQAAEKQANDERQASKPAANSKANKKSKGKGKKGKKDDWSDDEDKIAIKLEKKLQKDSRLMELESQVKVVNLNDYLEDEEDEDAGNRMANGELNDEVNTEVNDGGMNAETNEKPNKEESTEPGRSVAEQAEQQNNLQTDGEIVESSQEPVKNEESSEDEQVAAPEEESEEELEEETNDERKEAEYLKLVNTLTGQPLAEDLLMYCMPVVAPYNAVQNCKFKVCLSAS